MKSASKPIQLESILTKSASGWYYLTVSPEIAERFETDGKTRRVVCTLNESHTFQCALMPNKGRFTIGVSQPIRKKLLLQDGDTVTFRLEKDTSKYGMPSPMILRKFCVRTRKATAFSTLSHQEGSEAFFI